MIDTRLKVFRSVATLLSFTKAANELFISQPAISKHIQELEKEYGVQLFDRIGNRIQLTRAGLFADFRKQHSDTQNTLKSSLSPRTLFFSYFKRSMSILKFFFPRLFSDKDWLMFLLTIRRDCIFSQTSASSNSFHLAALRMITNTTSSLS